MLGKYASAYVIIVELIDGLIATLEDADRKNNQKGSDPNSGVKMLAFVLAGTEPRLPEHVAQRAMVILESVLDLSVSHMTFPSVKAQTVRVLDSVKNGDGPKAIALSVRELKTRLKDELIEREFFYVPPAKVPFYTDAMLFGKGVNDRFPQVIDDIEEAGKSLALGRGTACVLHTMRVLETGLKVMAKGLDIAYAPSWESYLKQIATNIGMERKRKPKNGCGMKSSIVI
jgi:hypothetical protein